MAWQEVDQLECLLPAAHHSRDLAKASQEEAQLECQLERDFLVSLDQAIAVQVVGRLEFLSWVFEQPMVEDQQACLMLENLSQAAVSLVAALLAFVKPDLE